MQKTLILCVLLLFPAFSARAADAAARQEIGVLINVIDHDYEKISPAQFAQLHTIGFRTIELGAYLKPLSPELLRTYTGLQFNTLANGGGLHDLGQSLDEVIVQAHLLHQKYVICYWPWIDGAEHVTVAQCRESGRLMNALGARCRQAGLRFAFHNHALEFAPLEGRMVIDWLLDACDPDLVHLELDIYHALHGKCAVIPFMRDHRGRIDILHLNTLDEKSENPVAGDGMADFAGILRTSREIGVHYLVIEGSGLRHPLRYLEESFNRVSRMSASSSP